MNAALFLIIGCAVLVVGYIFYGGWLAKKWGVDNSRPTPAHTMENIAELLGDAAIKFLRVYLKDRSYYEEAKSLLENYHLNVPISYMCADVCREELLIEIEGIAMK